MKTSAAPVIGLGITGAALAAVASTKSWLVLPHQNVSGAAIELPLANSAALVALAAWGVFLIARHRLLRSMLAAVSLLGALTVVVVAVTGRAALNSQAAAAGYAGVEPGLSGWFWASVFGAILCALAAAVAVVGARRWPTMGTKYDVPSGKPAEETDMWKAFDRGTDPTE